MSADSQLSLDFDAAPETGHRDEQACVLCNEPGTDAYVSSDLGYEGPVHKKCWREKFKEGNGYDPGPW